MPAQRYVFCYRCGPIGPVAPRGHHSALRAHLPIRWRRRSCIAVLSVATRAAPRAHGQVEEDNRFHFLKTAKCVVIAMSGWRHPGLREHFGAGAERCWDAGGLGCDVPWSRSDRECLAHSGRRRASLMLQQRRAWSAVWCCSPRASHMFKAQVADTNCSTHMPYNA